MKWDELLTIVNRLPCFTTGLLRTSGEPENQLQQQLTRWVQAGKLIQLRRGLYALSDPFRSNEPHPYFIASMMKPASYVSLQSALSHYELIPESVPVTTSVTTGRTERIHTSLGHFLYRHIKPSLFWGYEGMRFKPDQIFYLALAEKALIDLIYLTPDASDENYLRELRLQNMDQICSEKLTEMAERTKSPKIKKAVRIVNQLKSEEEKEYLPL